MTKIVHLQTNLPTSGNAAFRLHTAMREHGLDSKMLMLSSAVGKNEHIDHLGLKAHNFATMNNMLHAKLVKKSKKELGVYSYPILGNNVVDHQFIKNADVIYLHWINAGFLNLKNVRQLAELGKPIIFFMHDMWTITGGCHHSFDCDKFTKDCKSCPMFPKNHLPDLPTREFNHKKKLFEKHENIYFAAPSKWLYGLIKKSALTKEKLRYYIPNVIDHSLYKPFDKKAARKILNLDLDSTIISFGAMSPTSPYKGWSYLEQALKHLAEKNLSDNISVLIFGSDYNNKMDNAIPFKTYFTGRLRDDYSTALVYNASDIFMAPSVADNLPTTIMESLCCGTPVVGFKTGGIPDLIKHKENGYLAKPKNALDLANGIQYCLENKMDVRIPTDLESKSVLKRHLVLIDQINNTSKLND